MFFVIGRFVMYPVKNINLRAFWDVGVDFVVRLDEQNEMVYVSAGEGCSVVTMKASHRRVAFILSTIT